MGTKASSAVRTRPPHYAVLYWKLIVCGYVRLILKLSAPRDIQNILINYLFGENDFKFHHNEGNEELFEISNNGKTFKSTSNQYGTIMFGEFFKLNECKYTGFTLIAQFHEDVQPGYFGFGFLTPYFKEFKSVHFNPGNNHSTSIGGRGFFKHSDEFKLIKQYKHRESINHLSKWFKIRDQTKNVVAININMTTKIGRIWNWEINHEYKDNDTVFEIGLPNEVGIIFYYGRYSQTITIIDQILH